MLDFVTDERPVARKHHDCFHCGRSIVPGEQHLKVTTFDDGVQSARMHDDCEALLKAHMQDAQLSWTIDFPDGAPPLIEMLTDGGEFESECDFYRGRFPHAVTRMELTQQLADVEYTDRLRAAGIEPDEPPVYG